MYFGADYYPEHWVFPYDGTEDQPESAWEKDADKMKECGINVVRLGEFSWGLSEKAEGKYDFAWLRRAMDVFASRDIEIILATPTAAPPVWLLQQHRDILPLDENGLAMNEGTRRACCLNSDAYWNYSKKIIRAMADALSDHPKLIAWQIDNGVGRHNTEYSFNPETRRDWQAWLKAKYESIERLNDLLGTRFWGQWINDWSEAPMPKRTPAPHNPALLTDWRRFSSDTCVAFVRMQAELLREISPEKPLTTNMRPHACQYDYFDMAEVIDFVSVDSNATVHTSCSEVAASMDLMRCLKQEDIKAPGGGTGFWVIEQKAGSVSWQDVNSLLRPGVARLFTYQGISRGADGVCYFYWRQPRIGPEKFYGGVLTHDGEGKNRMYDEIRGIHQEMTDLAPLLEGSRVVAEACILVTHENEWAQDQPQRPNRHFRQRDHVQLWYNALYDRNIPCDFARPIDDLSKYKLVIAPSLHMIAGGEADRLALFVHNGGTLIGTCNTGLVDEYGIAPSTGYPYEMIDLFGLQVTEFDAVPPEHQNHLNFKGTFRTSHLHPATLWCDLIQPAECQVIGHFTKDFYANKPAVTINSFGEGKAVYVGTISHQWFYNDMIDWIRPQCNVHSILKVPNTVEVSMREKGNRRIYFLLNHQNSTVRVHFFKPTHDFLTGKKFSGNYDMPPHGVLVLDEKAR